MKEPADVFHYSDANGFLAITSNKKLWASCIEFLNDEKEFRHCLDLASELAERYRYSGPKPNERVSIFQEALKNLWGMFIFAISFSAQGDLLSQWCGYCGQGNGYNVGFNLQKLKNFCDKNNFLLKPCIYNHEEQAEVLNPIIKRFFDGGFDDLTISLPDMRIKKAAENAAYAVREHAPFMKNWAFREEEEWRLVSYTNFDDPKRKIRAGKHALIPYIEVDFMKDPDVFSQVTIGPGPFDRTKLHHIARTHLLNCDLGSINPINSAVPYRYW